MIRRQSDLVDQIRLPQTMGPIESQRWRPRSKVDPQDLIHLAQVAGMCLGMVLAFRPDVRILLPEPSDWKSSVPKDIFTARLRKRFLIDEPKKTRTPVGIIADGDTISEPLLPSVLLFSVRCPRGPLPPPPPTRADPPSPCLASTAPTPPLWYVASRIPRR